MGCENPTQVAPNVDLQARFEQQQGQNKTGEVPNNFNTNNNAQAMQQIQSQFPALPNKDDETYFQQYNQQQQQKVPYAYDSMQNRNDGAQQSASPYQYPYQQPAQELEPII